MIVTDGAHKTPRSSNGGLGGMLTGRYFRRCKS